jgi:hypothetical protein
VIAKVNAEQTLGDLATLDGLTAVAWEDSRGGIYFALTDSGGRVLVAPRLLSADGTRPRVVVSGARLHVYFADAVSGRLFVLVVNPATITAAATDVATILTDDLDKTGPVFDACSDSTAAVIAWWGSDAKIHVGYVHSSGVLGTPATDLVSPVAYTPDQSPLTAIGVTRDAGGTNQLAVVYAAGGAVWSPLS